MFLPIGDDNTRRTTTPVVVWVVFGINAVVWLLQLTLGERFTNGFAAIPYELTRGVDLTTAQLIDIGGGRVIQLPHFPGPTPIYLTVLSAMFMHGSWMHIIGNMVYLLIFADQIEDLLGHGRFVLFYLACGIFASVAHVLVGPGSTIPSLGASGAIAGVLGAYLLMYPGNPVRVLSLYGVFHVPAFIVLGGWVVLQVIGQVSVIGSSGGGVAYMAHIGGFAAGAALIYLLGGPRRREEQRLRAARLQLERYEDYRGYR